MKINKKILQTLKGVGYIGVIALWVVLIAASQNKQQDFVCKELVVNIDHHTGLFFIQEDEVFEILNHETSNGILNEKIRTLPLNTMERRLNANPFIKNAQIFAQPNGRLVVDIKQRKPLIRVINKNNVSYYLDMNGNPMPISYNFTPRVPVVNGFIYQNQYKHERDSLIQLEIYELGQFIHESDFWSAFIQQIYVNENREFELIPRLGNQYIIFGNIESMEEKFTKLYIFYREGLKTGSWDKYKSINLKYKNQIICSKI
ncbi:MAG: hypothetical protein EA412_07420 [Chitinophagaceae bacterium]|nr:MAG: hypothetical protein EA412_07420 [Chitinophagaceae bacterium]